MFILKKEHQPGVYVPLKALFLVFPLFLYLWLFDDKIWSALHCDIFFCFFITREIGRMDSADLSRDTSGTRAYTQFLVEMTENNPAAVLPNISLVLCHLDGEVILNILKPFSMPTVMILNFWTDKSGQTVQTQIRLLPEEQSDQGLHCLLFHLLHFDKIPCNLLESYEKSFIDDFLTFSNHLSRNMRKPTMWILNRSDTNQAVQPLEMARGLKFCN